MLHKKTKNYNFPEWGKFEHDSDGNVETPTPYLWKNLEKGHRRRELMQRWHDKAVHRAKVHPCENNHRPSIVAWAEQNPREFNKRYRKVLG